MISGFDKPLYILPFDQRESLENKMFGWKGALNAEQTAEIADAKRVIFDGFRAAVADGVAKEYAAILVDEQFGAAILRDASQQGFMTACPTEKSGQDEFDFEYGEDFAAHVETVDPTFCKVLVRYNPEGDKAMNRQQAARLKRLCDYLKKTNRLFMAELLVAAEPAQLAKCHGQKDSYDCDLRPSLMVGAIRELQDAGVNPDVWKVEGLGQRSEAVDLVAVARRDGRDDVGCIILGGGKNEQQVHDWLAIAASVPGFVGFAVGRTTFWDPLVNWREKKTTRDGAVAEIARRYREWVDIFETNKKKAVEKSI